MFRFPEVELSNPNSQVSQCNPMVATLNVSNVKIIGMGVCRGDEGPAIDVLPVLPKSKSSLLVQTEFSANRKGE